MYKILFFFLLFFAFSLSWGACETYDRDLTAGGSGCYSCPGSADCTGCLGWGLARCEDPCQGYSNCAVVSEKYCKGRNLYATLILCSNQCETDSIRGCPEGYVWNSDSCKCEKQCTDSLRTYKKCAETWNNGYLVDSEGNPGGGGYWQINIFNCTYDPCDSTEICTEGSHFPAGTLTCDDFRDGGGCQGADCGRCIASIGSQCTIQCPNNVTINCACDGSCDHAKTVAACHCPEQSSSSGGGSSSSGGGSSSSGDGSSSSMSSSSAQSSSSELPRSSSSPKDSSNGDWEYDYSQVLNEIETNTRRTASNTQQIASNTNEIATNTNIAAGYLSSIDKWQSTINMQNQTNANEIKSSVEDVAGAVAQATSAVDKNTDTLHHSNELIESVRSRMVSLFFDSTGDMQSKVDSINSLVWSYRDTVAKYDSSISAAMKRRDTTSISMDSINIDSSQYRTKYKDLYLSDAVTREGCYILRIRGNSLMKTVEVDFSDIGGFNLCGIIRGFLRVCTLILITIIEINFFKRAFASGDN